MVPRTHQDSEQSPWVEVSAQVAEGVESAPRFRTAILGSLVVLFLGTLLLLILFLAREKGTFVALVNPDRVFEAGVDEAARLEARKAAILRSLNEDINLETRGKNPEESRLLASLDRLWRTVKRYVSPAEELPPPQGDNSHAYRVARSPSRHVEGFPSPKAVPPPEEVELEDVLYHILSLVDESSVVPEARPSSTQPKQAAARPLVAGKPPPLKTAEGSSGGSWTLDDVLYNLEPRGGVRTRGAAWRLNRNLTLEGTLDTTQEGRIDGDLSDFGFRSVHALTFLRNMPQPMLTMEAGSIDSGYPRSYGIGLNYRISSSMQMLFDYSHEYPSDYFIEYRGNWESSLLTDYAKKRPENEQGDLSVHNFFLGVRYLHRLREVLIPVHTGFFYSTNMADESFPSDVSMGFSVGGGYQKKALQLGVSYRLRIWENPDDKFVADLPPEEAIATRMSNQLLFFIAF